MFAGLICLDGLRHETIERERLVERARHQGLENIPVQALRGRTGLQVEGVQAVEGPLETDREAPALGCVRVGIGQVGKIGRERRFAMHGQAVCGGFCGARGSRARKGGEQAGEQGTNQSRNHGRQTRGVGRVREAWRPCHAIS